MGAGREPLTPLEQAVEDAYRVFKAEPPDHWSGDDMGLGKKEWARLTNVPLRELNPADTYNFLSETGQYNRRELGYLLPRMLEILAAGDDPTPLGIECSLICLADAGYPNDWTAEERKVVETFMAAMVDECLSEHGFADGPSLGEVLCMACSANVDLDALLGRIDRAGDKWAARALAFDLECLGGISDDGTLVNAFWENASPEHSAAVSAWYRRDGLLDCLEGAFFAETDPAWQRRFSGAVETIRIWGTKPGTRDTPPA